MVKMCDKAGAIVLSEPALRRTPCGLVLAFWMLCAIGLTTSPAVRAQTPVQAATSGSAAHTADQSPKRRLKRSRAKLKPAKERAAEPARRHPAASANTEKPAQVTLENGLLTVRANNSSLSQIMGQIAAAGSMSIDGEVGGSRVYGVYGPDVPGAVITKLLEGAGYNLLMVGVGPEGTPRKLILTPKVGGVTAPSQTAVVAAAPENPESVGSDGEPLGPGAIANTPPPPSEDPQERLKQTLHRLQQMQDQQSEPQIPK